LERRIYSSAYQLKNTCAFSGTCPGLRNKLESIQKLGLKFFSNQEISITRQPKVNPFEVFQPTI
jgi:hypothetical protein